MPTNPEDIRLMVRAFRRSRLRRLRGGSCFFRQALPWVSVIVPALLFAAPTCQADEAPTVYSRFGYCAAPTPPSCVDTMNRGGPSAACRADAEAYVASVFRYRECLSAEMQRAVREANGVIDRIRCAVDRSTCDRGDSSDAPSSGKGEPVSRP